MIALPDDLPDRKQLLRDWETATAAIINFDARFDLYVYDEVFNVETRSSGRLYFERPGRGRLESYPVAMAPKVGAGGFRVQSGEVWGITWTDLAVTMREREISQRYPRPVERSTGSDPGHRLAFTLSTPQ